VQQQILEQFEQALNQQDRDYIVDQWETDQACLLRFIGNFEGQPVVWHAHLQTLRNYAENTSTAESSGLRQFIQLDKQQDRYRLRIGLNLEKIDEAAILRTIIMIRQYKRLHQGRHEYGAVIQF